MFPDYLSVRRLYLAPWLSSIPGSISTLSGSLGIQICTNLLTVLSHAKRIQVSLASVFSGETLNHPLQAFRVLSGKSSFSQVKSCCIYTPLCLKYSFWKISYMSRVQCKSFTDLHKVNKSLHTIHRHTVVDRGPHSSHRAVALQLHLLHHTPALELGSKAQKRVGNSLLNLVIKLKCAMFSSIVFPLTIKIMLTPQPAKMGRGRIRSKSN